MSKRNSLERVEHEIEPVFDERSQMLVLGTMPSPKSREIGFYYGHPQNRFWRVLAALFDEPVPEDNAQRIDLLLRHHIALWDVLASCDIEGASDASIANAVPNDLSRIMDTADIGKVLCTGATSARLYGRLCEPQTGIPAVRLPSTSPANAAWSLDRLCEAYRVMADSVAEYDPPVLDVPEVVELEQAIAASGTSLAELMRRAGRFIAYEARKLIERDGLPVDALRPVVILCGNGNNGGDGWVAAEYLDLWGYPVRIVTAKVPEELTAEPARSAALRAVETLGERSAVIVAPSDRELASLLADAPVAIDAILGTGFSHDSVRAPFDAWIDALNAAHERGIFVIAADVPSGLSAQTGRAAAQTVDADLTVTMIVPKPGLATGEGPAHCGSVRVAPLAYVEPLLEEGV